MSDAPIDNSLHLQTKKSAEELVSRLKEYEPWGHLITFSNGISTANLERRVPFNDYPLSKIQMVEQDIPFSDMRGGRLLDIGSNTGHNSIYVAEKYGIAPTGIDVTTRHMEVSTMLSEMAGIDGKFIIGNAETYIEEGAFDVVVHFGTLYHLPNPLLSLQSTWHNLKPGGYLALETQVYEHEDDPNICYFMHMHNNDKSNFWALSPHVINTCLELLGFENIKVIRKIEMPILAPGMSRLVLTAQKPAT